MPHNPDAQSTKPTAAQFDVKKSSTGMDCSMTGMVNMVIEATELVLVVLSMYKEVIASMLPKDLKKSLKYFYQGLSGASSWLGFFIAALYFAALDQGYGAEVCEGFGYLDVVIGALYQLIDFGGSIDQDSA